MKTSVAITLIICGTGLLALPYIHNTIAAQRVADAMVTLQKDVNLSSDIPWYADFLCMVSGIVMIVFGASSQMRRPGAGAAPVA